MFFWIQGKNTKMLNLIWKERYAHLVENSINSLLWMKNGCTHLKNESQKRLDIAPPLHGLIEKTNPKSLNQLTSELREANDNYDNGQLCSHIQTIS